MMRSLVILGIQMTGAGSMQRITRTRSLRRVGLAHAVVLMISACSSSGVAFSATGASLGSSLDGTAAAFKPYVLEQIGASLTATRAMRERVAAGDLAGAQQSWLAARDGWERSEIIAAELFPDLDRAIDAWPDAQRGFHAIEARLFGAHNVDALGAADELVRNLAEFERQFRASPLRAQTLLNGVTKLLYEIGEDKSGGGESPFSGNSLQEVLSNVTAINAAYQRVFARSVQRQNAQLGITITADLERLRQITSVQRLNLLDADQLRDLTETLTGNFISAGRELGLQSPQLGN
jgi:iron uptake system component EfeO